MPKKWAINLLLLELKSLECRPCEAWRAKVYHSLRLRLHKPHAGRVIGLTLNLRNLQQVLSACMQPRKGEVHCIVDDASYCCIVEPGIDWPVVQEATRLACDGMYPFSRTQHRNRFNRPNYFI